MFDTEIATASRTWNVPESWIRAVIETESGWNAQAYREEPKINDASYGLMQLLYSTALGLGFTGTSTGLYDPATNIDLGTKLLGQLRKAYGDDFRRVYSAYNSGNPDLWARSKEVAAHVARAVDNLSKWVQTEVAEVTRNPESSSVVGLVLLVLLWAWVGKRK